MEFKFNFSNVRASLLASPLVTPVTILSRAIYCWARMYCVKLALERRAPSRQHPPTVSSPCPRCMHAPQSMHFT